MRLHKHKPTSHRKATQGRKPLLSYLPRRTPRHSAARGPLPALPPGSMPQRSLPPRTAHAQVPTNAELTEAARRLTGSFSGHFRLAEDAPLFRDDETTWRQFEDSRLERLRRIQQLGQGWPDAHGVNLGSDQSPRTLVFSTSDYKRFSDGTDTIPAVKR